MVVSRGARALIPGRPEESPHDHLSLEELQEQIDRDKRFLIESSGTLKDFHEESEATSERIHRILRKPR